MIRCLWNLLYGEEPRDLVSSSQCCGVAVAIDRGGFVWAGWSSSGGHRKGNTVSATIIRFVDLLLVALLAGAIFGIWIGFNPAGLSPGTYVEQQQHAILALNTFMPLLGAVCIVLTVALAVLTKGDRGTRYLLIATAVCLLIAGVVTRFENQPINSIVMTWSPQAPPPNWTELRDTWWQWHIVRTVAGIAALCLLILAVLSHRRPPG